MAAVCALALAFVLMLPLGPRRRRGEPPAGSAARSPAAEPAAADADCKDPEKQTLAPSSADGPTIDAIKAGRARSAS